MNLEVGSTVGDYQVVGILGAGGMGQVYKVRNVISDRVEAMKVLLPDLVNQPDLADRFLREIKVQASLEHPNIAALHTAVRQENQLLMLMEFVEGVTLDQKLKGGPLPAAEAVNYVLQVLAALEYAHARGVVHRDIKPANMMLTPGGIVKLMDFGIARSSADHKLTQTGTTVGSLYYMSPEQIQGVTAPDARSDLYSVGVSLYELVTGKRPFDGDSQFAIMSAHLQGTPVPPVTIDPRLPQLLNDVILMLVAKIRTRVFRPPRGGAQRAFQRVCRRKTPAASPTVAAVPVGQPARTVQPVKPSRTMDGAWRGGCRYLPSSAVVAIALEREPRTRGKVAAPAAQPVASEPPAPVAAQPPCPAGTASSATGRRGACASGRHSRRCLQPSNRKPSRSARTAGAAKTAPAGSQSAAPAPLAAQPAGAGSAARRTANRQPLSRCTTPAPTGPSRAELQQVRESIALVVRAPRHTQQPAISATLASRQRTESTRGHAGGRKSDE
jgi:serine/threonine-protein kinase